MPKEIRFNPGLSQHLRSGSEALRRTVERNYGPAGRNTICDQKFDLPLVANTGRKVLKDFSLENPAENLSAVLIREAALQVASEFGDGSIATAVLSDALIAAGYGRIAGGYNPMLLRRGLEKALALLHGLLEPITIPFEQIGAAKLAAAASKNDEVAEKAAKAFELVGTDGVITVQDSQLCETVLNFWDGVRYEYGLYSTGFINDPGNRRAVLSEPYVFLSNTAIRSVQDIRKLLEDVLERNASLLIIASDISEDVQQILCSNLSRGLKAVAVKAPGYGEERRRNMLSLAAKIGSLLFDENTGQQMSGCGLEVCSRVSRVEADKNSTLLQGFRDSSMEMTELLRQHTVKQLEKTFDPDEREKLQITLSILNGKTAEILVGSPTEYAMFEKKYLYENTVRIVRNGARSGLVPGAGNAYLYLETEIRKQCQDWPESEAQGAHCLCDCLRSLTRLLAENAGENPGSILAKVQDVEDALIGYDILSGKLVDLKEAGILTPADNLEAIIKTAGETAASLWTTAAAILEV